MQAERIQICSKALMNKGFTASWFIPLQIEATVHDVLKQFALFITNGSTEHIEQFPLLKTCFQTLVQEQDECMFVFMNRYEPAVAGILRSTKPLLTHREQQLVQVVENNNPWNVPLWTWTDSDMRLLASMEKQCVRRDVKGLCMGIWCYR
jgi:hypothetical protein